MRPNVAILLLLAASPLFAHANPDLAAGFASGFLHPLSGWDHVLAMVAVGIWGTQLGAPAIWILPVTFPLVMSLGGLLGVRGVNLPGTQLGIALSALVLGALIAKAARPPLWIAGAIVGAFAIFHGYAHGIELPNASDPLAYGVGFVLCTGLLHATGIAIGAADRWPSGSRFLRVMGGGIACAGFYLVASLGRPL